MTNVLQHPQFPVRERIRWKQALLHLLRYLMIPVLMLLPKSWILSRLRALIADRIYISENSQVIFHKSGRSAIRAWMNMLKEKQNRQIAFIPDYICNVVPRACQDAGFILKEYLTDEHFAPVWDQLEQMLCQDNRAVLFICSLMGSSPVLAPEMTRLEELHPDLFVIADECQNLIEHSPVRLTNNRAIVFSFNDKTCPGIMGGGIVCSSAASLIPGYESVSLRKALKCSFFFAGSMVKRMIRDTFHIMKLVSGRRIDYAVPLRYEYSTCQNTHYDTRPEPIYRISAAYALLNLYALRSSAKVRRENFQVLVAAEGRNVAAKHKDSLTLPAPAFMPLLGEVDISKKYPAPIKAPYAKHSDPAACSRKYYAFKLNVPYVLYKN